MGWEDNWAVQWSSAEADRQRTSQPQMTKIPKDIKNIFLKNKYNMILRILKFQILKIL